jgi:hypothetical protein
LIGFELVPEFVGINSQDWRVGEGAVTAAFSLVETPVCAPAMALLDIVGMSEAYAELADLQSTVCF